MMIERKITVTVVPAHQNGGHGHSHGGQRAGLNIDQEPAPYDHWADGRRSLDPMAQVEELHKLTVEVAGTRETRPQGQLIAVAHSGLTIKNDLYVGPCNGHRRQEVTEKLKPDQYTLHLKLRDHRHGSHAIPLPMGQPADTCPISTQKDQWETILIPIVPRCYTSYRLIRDTGHTDSPRPGWIYIYSGLSLLLWS